MQSNDFKADITAVIERHCPLVGILEQALRSQVEACFLISVCQLMSLDAQKHFVNWICTDGVNNWDWMPEEDSQ